MAAAMRCTAPMNAPAAAADHAETNFSAHSVCQESWMPIRGVFAICAKVGIELGDAAFIVAPFFKSTCDLVAT